jgi:hypothetical protein
MMHRRQALSGAVAFGATAFLPGSAGLARDIPQRASVRVIVDNDFHGDPDGLVALAHHLLSPKAKVPLVTVSGLNPQFAMADGRGGDTIAPGVEKVRTLAAKLRVAAPSVAAGREPGAQAGTLSDAAQAIVAEARRADALPLFLACGGPLTNVADALIVAPEIAGRMTLIWIGGGGWPDGGWEYNLATDVAAARQVIEQSRVPLWQVPQPTYRKMQVSVAEMTADMRPISPFTEWLYDQFTSPPDFVDLGGTWPMGDTPPVLLTALSPDSGQWREVTARRIGEQFEHGEEIPGRTIRLYDDFDMRLAWADFLAKLRLNALAQ